MTTQATLTYTAYLAGLSSADASALVAAVPLPQDVLDFLGLRVTSDTTPNASPAVRTIVVGFNPASNATATATLADSGASGSPIGHLTVTGPGSGYVAPPVVSFTGGLAPGVEQTQMADDPNQLPFALVYLKVVSAAIVAGGSGYTAATKIVVSGKLKSTGAPPPFSVGGPLVDAGQVAVLTPTIGGGVITGVAVTFAGQGYVGVPTITVVDPGGGTGAVISVSMGVGEIVLLRSGGGFRSAPTVVLTPSFQAFYPAGSSPHVAQQAPLRNLFNVILEKALLSPVSAGAPVVT